MVVGEGWRRNDVVRSGAPPLSLWVGSVRVAGVQVRWEGALAEPGQGTPGPTVGVGLPTSRY